MTMMKFRSDAPSAFAADVDHGDLGAKLEHLMRQEAYLNPHHKDHIEVVDRVKDIAATIYGEQPTDHSSQPFRVFSFNSRTGEATTQDGIGITNVYDPKAIADDENKSD